MTLDEKTSLTAGASLWYLPPVERLGIPALKVSDGPSGVRGDSLIGRRSLSLPCGMAIGSTWNPELARELGDVLAAEARSKGVHVLLGPTVCIVRTPLAGRTFESFSEDPLLTARIAVAYVEGVQAGGVACCIKHFACNDQEHERMTISAEVEERTLREIHLVAFEAAVQEAGVWSVMTAYNKVNGVYCGEQPDLIGGILRGEWGFDGLVDVGLVRDALHGAGGAGRARPRDAGALGLARPHPGRRRPRRRRRRVGGRRPGAPRAAAHGAGRDPGRDDGARRTGGGRPGPAGGGPPVAAEGTVLLVNDGLLPLDPGGAASVAVIGPNAGQLAMGGGSSEVTPHRRRRVAEALAERLPVPRSPPRSAAGSTAGCRRSTCGSWLLRAARATRASERATRAFSSSTSTTRSSPAHRWRRRRRTRRGSCGSVPRARGSPSASTRSGSPPRSPPTCRARGGSGSRAPGGPCCASTATSSSTTPSRPVARASTAPGASPSR